MRINNRGIPAQVSELSEFRTKNQTVFSRDYGHQYVVYSYGYHWPLAVYDRGTCTWYVNEDKYSVTTSRHFGLVNLGATLHMERNLLKTDKKFVGILDIQKYITGKTEEVSYG